MIHPITFEELRESWPKDASGLQTAELIQRYLITLATNTALGAECTADRAQAEAAVNKALARMYRDFSSITVTPENPPSRPQMKTLRRFDKPENPETK